MDKTDLKNKVSEMFMCGLMDGHLTDSDREYLKEMKPGAINLTYIFFQKFKMKYKTGEYKEKLFEIILELRKIIGPQVLIGINHEGGFIQNLPPPDWALLPCLRQIGQKNCKESALKLGKLLGTELRLIGVDWNFAPVIDTSHNKDYYYRIFGRSISDDPDVVGTIGSQIIKGVQEEGIIACAKHFPNMGSTTKDSHKDKPIIESSKEVFEEKDIFAFKTVIEEGKVKSVMTNHALYTNIDKENVATFSKIINIDILRKNLKFEGLLLTDDLGMFGSQCIKDEKKIKEKDFVKLVIEAGNDVMMYNYRRDDCKDALKSVREMIDNDEIDLKTIEESLERIAKYKKDHFEFKKNLIEEDKKKNLNYKDTIGCKEHEEYCRSFPHLLDPVVEERYKKIKKNKNTVGMNYRKKPKKDEGKCSIS